MLLRFAVANHLSIRDRQELSLVASKLSDRSDGLIGSALSPSGGVLPAVVIYGANASGKSNLVDALHTMREMILRSYHADAPAGGVSARRHFRLDGVSKSAPSCFEADFVLDGVRHHYGFQATDKAFAAEWLQDYPTGRPRTLFERRESEFTFGRSLKGRNRVIADLTRDNCLFLSAAAQNGHEKLTSVHSYFAHVNGVTGTTVSGNQAATVADDRLDGRILRFLDALDSGIVGHRVREVALSESDRRLMSKLAELGVKTPPERMSLLELAHRSASGKDVYFEFERESAGTRRLVVVLAHVFAALDAGTLLVVDELDSSLHTAASQAVLALFSTHATNPRGAQLIATAHDTNLLDAPVLRRDQVWFAEKSLEGATRTYPLTDIRTRKGDNLRRGYLQRRYGAAPRGVSPSRLVASCTVHGVCGANSNAPRRARSLLSGEDDLHK